MVRENTVQHSHWLIGVLSLAWIGTALPASAQPGAPEPPAPARAAALLEEGRKQLEQGKLESACGLLAGSDALDPTGGALALLAQCHEQQGRLATAWKDYGELGRRAATGSPQADLARQRAALLEPRLPRISIRLPHPPPGVVIRCDLDALPATVLDGAGVPVDPGAHEIVAQAPGYADRRTAISAQEGVAATVDLLPLDPTGQSGGPPGPRPGDAPKPPDHDGGDSRSPAGGPSARTVAGFAVGGLGLVGIGIGTAFGVSALDKNRQSNDVYNTCGAPGAAKGACAQGRDLRNGAFSAATASTVGFSVGAAGVAVGAALILWPSAKPSGASASNGPRGGRLPPRSALRLVPLAGPRLGGVVLTGEL